MKIAISLTELKSLVKKERNEAKKEASECYSCIRSRGVCLRAFGSDHEAFNEDGDDEYTVLTLKGLNEDIANYASHGATEFYLDGGFDGADSVYDLNNFCYDPRVSEWSIQLDVSQ